LIASSFTGSGIDGVGEKTYGVLPPAGSLTVTVMFQSPFALAGAVHTTWLVVAVSLWPVSIPTGADHAKVSAAPSGSAASTLKVTALLGSTTIALCRVSTMMGAWFTVGPPTGTVRSPVVLPPRPSLTVTVKMQAEVLG